MRKSILSVVFACLALTLWIHTGCTDKKPAAVETVVADSVASDTIVGDTLDLLIADEPMPEAADELFDDFIFNFAANRKLQMNRIVFPLPNTTGNTTRYTKRAQWKMEHFFMRQGFYTQLLDSPKDMELGKDTSISHVVIEKIFLNDAWVRQYVFDRKGGQWMLCAIDNMSVEKNANASFLEFYHKFSTDSVFQVESMNASVEVTTPDPDDDFGMQTGVIDPEQWPAFKPALIPTGLIYNIIYGNQAVGDGQKIFLVRGVANGFEAQMVFRRQGDKWKLVKIIN